LPKFTARFLARRVIAGIVTLLVVTMLVFGLSRIQGDPRSLLISEDATQAQWDELGERLGLDQPVFTQYLRYLGNLVRGDLGDSTLQRRPVAEILWSRIPNSAILGAAAFAFAILVGVSLGVLSAVNRGGLWDQAVRSFAVLGQALPVFWVALLLIYIFAVGLDWVPASRNTGWRSLILPAITLGWFGASGQVRILRSSMLDVLDSEYVRLARAKGASERAVVWKHAFRNALLGPLTFAALTMAGLITGSIVVETVFAWPGLGLLAVQAVSNSDYPILQGVILLVTLVFVVANCLVDVLYMVVDPRIRIR
jgi:peptide/nickel transport system permease protein